MPYVKFTLKEALELKTLSEMKEQPVATDILLTCVVSCGDKRAGTIAVAFKTLEDANDKDKARYITTSSKNNLANFVANTMSAPKYTPSVHVGATVVLVSDALVKYQVERTARQPGVVPVVFGKDSQRSGTMNINVLLSVLLNLDGMTESLNDYCLIPDPGVTVIRKINKEIDVVNSEGKKEKVQAWDYVKKADGIAEMTENHPFTRTTAQWQAIAFFYLMAMTKDIKTNFDTYIKQRTNALKGLLMTNDLSEAVIRETVSPGDLSTINSSMQIYPILRTLIFRPILLSRNSTVNDYALKLLAQNQLTTYNLVAKFIAVDTPSALHVYPEIIAEYDSWRVIKEQLELKYNDAWPYAKLLNPADMSTSATNYPKLAAAALLCQDNRGKTIHRIPNGTTIHTNNLPQISQDGPTIWNK